MIHKDRVLKLYNFHHFSELNKLPDYNLTLLDDDFVYEIKDFFIHEAIYFNLDMDKHFETANHLIYYIPSLEELTNYEDQFYFQRTRHHDLFETFMLNVVFPKDHKTAEFIIEDVFYGAQQTNHIDFALKQFERRNVNFKNINFSKLTELLKNVLNHSRMWKYNALTFNEYEHFLMHGTISSLNGLCHCGSQKKYKRCCYELEKNLWENDDLSYDETFEFTQQEILTYKKKVTDELKHVPSALLDLVDPSLSNLIDALFEEVPLDIFVEEPIHVLSAVIFILMDHHDIDFDVINPWIRKHKLNQSLSHINKLKNRYYYAISDHELNELNELNDYLEPLMDYFVKHNHANMVMIPEKRPYQFLMKAMKKKKVDPDLIDETHEIAEIIYQSIGATNPLYFYNLLLVCPHAFLVIEMLLSDSNVQDNHLDLLNAFVYAYEIYHKEMFNHPPKEFTKHEYNKTYILALDALGMLYKESGDFKEAIKVYEKIIRYDDEDRFGAKESILICYVLTGQMEKYDELLNSLPYDSVYYMTLMLYIKIITGDSFYKEYIDVLKRSPDLLDVLCDIKDIEDIEYDLPVQMFLADFQGFFNMTPGLLEPLKQMHLKGD
jgi:hypothetical protein